MLPKFVELPSFTRASRDLLGDTELRELQAFMMENPQAPLAAGAAKSVGNALAWVSAADCALYISCSWKMARLC